LTTFVIKAGSWQFANEQTRPWKRMKKLKSLKQARTGNLSAIDAMPFLPEVGRARCFGFHKVQKHLLLPAFTCFNIHF